MLSMPVFNGCYHHNGGACRGNEGGNVWVGYGGHWQWCGGGDGCLDGVVRLREPVSRQEMGKWKPKGSNLLGKGSAYHNVSFLSVGKHGTGGGDNYAPAS